MSENKIELYKTRDFGQKLNATIEYIRYNLGSLIKLVLIVVVPLGLFFSIFFSNIFGTIIGMSAQPDMSDAEAVGMMGSLGINYMLTIVLSMVTYSLMVSSIFIYMKKVDEGESPEVMEVLKIALGKVPGLIGLGILVAMVSFLGMLFFVIPGIYLAVALSLAYPIYIFEEIGITDAFSKAFKLIRDKWWSTFGLLFVASMIAGMVSYVFVIPGYLLMFSKLFSNIGEAQDPNAMAEMFSGWYTSAGLAIMMIGSYITYIIPIIALAFQYFNLSERQEGTGLRSQIQDFEKLD